jgi:hypothetical protein
MTVAQGISKTTSYKKQSALGTPQSGSGGQKLRRTSSVFQSPADSYESNEIVSHQQSTGVTLGVVKPAGKIDGLLSPGTYSVLLASLLRKDLAAVSDIASLSLTIATSGSNYTITRGSGSFITDGLKVGNVIRITAGTYTAGTKDKNLLIIALTATVATVKVINATALTAEGPIASSTVSLIGKKTYAPASGHTTDYYSFEEWYPDVARSELYADVMIAQAQLNLPATGNATISLDAVGRSRTLAASQVLTTPTAETTTDVLTAVNGLVMVNGSIVTNLTGAQITINGNTAHSDATVGSNTVDDMQRGRIAVSGSFTAKFDAATLQLIYEARSAISLILCVTEDNTATADFVVLTLPTIKLTGDAPDDGEKAIIRTYPFTAQYNGAGGAATTSDQTIIAIQDSAS